MPWQYKALKDVPEPLGLCPKCGAKFRSFLRGMVHSPLRRLIRGNYCAVICQECKEIVGYERPPTFIQTAADPVTLGDVL